MNPATLPAGIRVFQRGWLSSNNVLLWDEETAALVDSGYATHSTQTLDLVTHALGLRPLTHLYNTHLHSDHCGGNAALQARYPSLYTAIPPGLAQAVAQWDPHALTYEPTGQQCPRFTIQGLLKPGDGFRIGSLEWEVHAAPGHDTHSIILFEPGHRILISADALWQTGFGVVFPELEGESAFHEVGATLDVIERLAPLTVIPGHGAPFTDFHSAMSAARRRLDGFLSDPVRHGIHAAKVLLKFKLLEWQSVPMDALCIWAGETAYLQQLHARLAPDTALAAWIENLAQQLVQVGAAKLEGRRLLDA